MLLLYSNFATNACFQTLLLVNYHINLPCIENMIYTDINIFNYIFTSD